MVFLFSLEQFKASNIGSLTCLRSYMSQSIASLVLFVAKHTKKEKLENNLQIWFGQRSGLNQNEWQYLDKGHF